MTSLLGKKKFNELLSGFITKPQGKPTTSAGVRQKTGTEHSQR